MVRAPCCEKEGLKKGRWTDEEDGILTRYVQANGEGSWRSVPKNAGLHRCGKSCRLRWINYLRPDLKRGNISPEEEAVIIRLHASMGNRWSLIAGHLPGRTDNEIKNYWNSHLSRKLLTFSTPTKSKRTEPDGPTEVTAEWKPRKGRSRQRASQRNSTALLKHSSLLKSTVENGELEPIAKEKTVEPNANEESFEITEYINEEGEDNTSSLNAEESLIFSSVHEQSYFNDEQSEIFSSFDDALNIKVDETDNDVSMHNLIASSVDQKNGIKGSQEVDTVAANWNEKKSLSLSSADDAWADWDWKGLINGQKLIDEDEMLTMLWDDGSNFKSSNH
uniref:Uncharacterized protein n=1 Tax=Kalanchoe fedtschenkoi TaxID=63787 RepID=A0A7N0U3C7_KALFE